MKVIDIVGENYFGKWDKTRTACRGIIIHDTKVLLSYETRNDQWMLPGGGLEDNESEKACCIREIAEETGMVADISECILEIDEYYEDWKWINTLVSATGSVTIRSSRILMKNMISQRTVLSTAPAA